MQFSREIEIAFSSYTSLLYREYLPEKREIYQRAASRKVKKMLEKLTKVTNREKGRKKEEKGVDRRKKAW